MIQTDLRPLLKGNISRYSLCTAVAKRARDITQQAVESKEILDINPVTEAVDELSTGVYGVYEPTGLRRL